jgi:hypothetical protein
MAKELLMSAVLAAAVASLTGCAGLSADVHAVGPVNSAVVLRSGSTYTIARLPLQDGSADQLQFEARLREELGRRGFTDAAHKPAQYLLSIAYATRPAAIGVGIKDCPAGECEPGTQAPFSLFGSRAYRHALTLRFFDRASGEQRYKVSAVMVDRDADPLHAMPALVKSALAKFPFDAPPDWRVKLRIDEAGTAPEVVSVKPVQR